MDISRLVIVSNRLPIAVAKNDDGEYTVKPGSGGLVTAVSPVLRDKGGLWIGWSGTTEKEGIDKLIADSSVDAGYDLKPINLSEDELNKYYYGFSNEILWPLFHDLLDECNFDPSYFPIYDAVNKKFAEAILSETQESDYIWVQDYQLSLVASHIRKMGGKRKTGFFLHIPFPPLDMFLRLPWREQILRGLLQYDLIGFQTQRDRRNFVECVRRIITGSKVSSRSKVSMVEHEGRSIGVGAFPISIDYKDFAARSKTEEAAKSAWFIHEKFPDRHLIMGVDRLDYTKGIPHRLRALDLLFEKYPELKGKITFIQVTVPSRTEVPKYQALKDEIEGLVGEINGKHTEFGWTPIHYIFRSLDKTELLGLYRTCEIALITPLKDGMNLVAKEYCACDHEGNGVLILSEFAGAADQLGKSALLVNPFDIEKTAEAIHQALIMPEAERKSRMRKLRRSIKRADIFKWVDSYLQSAVAKNLNELEIGELASAALQR